MGLTNIDAAVQGSECMSPEVELTPTQRVAEAIVGTGKLAGATTLTAGVITAPKSAANPIQGLQRTGSALKTDPYHAFPDVVDNFAGSATRTPLQSGANLYQVEGSLNGAAGRSEWIVQEGQVTHRMFVPGGSANGVPIKP